MSIPDGRDNAKSFDKTYAAHLDKFLKHLWRGGEYAYYWTAPGLRSHWHRIGDGVPLATPLPPDEPGKHIYFGVYPATRIPPTNAKGEPAEPENVRLQVQYLAAMNCLFAEFDGKDFDPDDPLGAGKDAAIGHIMTLIPEPSIVVDSGGGYHCYWLLEEPHVPETDRDRRVAQYTQAAWTEWAGGDGGAKDLSRVLRVPGTYNVKDVYPEPIRVEFMRTDFDNTYTWAQLYRIVRAEVERRLDRDEQTNRTRSNGNSAHAGDGDPVPVEAKVEAALEQLADWRCDEYDEWRRIGCAVYDALGDAGFDLFDDWSRQSSKYDSHVADQKYGPDMLGGNSGGSAVTEATLYYAADQDAGSTDWRKELWRKYGRPYSRNGDPRTDDGRRVDPGTGEIIEPAVTIDERIEQADDWRIDNALKNEEHGDATLFAHLYRGRLLYDYDAKTWFIWNGDHWQRDKGHLIRHLIAGQLASQYLGRAADLLKQAEALEAEGKDDDAAKAKKTASNMIQRKDQLRRLRRDDRIVAYAEDLLAAPENVWDSKPYLLGVENGVVNMQTGEFRRGRPDDYIRTVIPTKWEGLDGFDSPCDRWERFMREIFAGDQKLVAFMQRLLGYALTGSVIEHKLPILWGEGRNGKDTMLETLSDVLGGAAKAVSTDVITDLDRRSGSATPHLYELWGKRLVWASETNEGARLDAGRVKLITGGGQITARALYENEVTFRPTHTLMLITNHRPHAPADDFALWERLLLVPFTQKFIDDPDPDNPNEHPADKTLKRKLKEEASGILAWLVRGALMWKETGLRPPESVTNATAQYQEDEDTLGLFIKECCVVHEQAKAPAQLLYDTYNDWSRDGGMKPMSLTAFGKKMKRRFEYKRTSAGMQYLGIGIELRG